MSVCPLNHLELLFIVKTLPRTQQATKVKLFVAFFSETVPLQRSSTLSHDGHIADWPFFLQRTCMRIVHTQVLDIYDVMLPT